MFHGSPKREGCPNDFDAFLPWAAKKLQLTYHIVVKRRAQDPPPQDQSQRSRFISRKSIFGIKSAFKVEPDARKISDRTVDIEKDAKQDAKSITSVDVNVETISIISCYDKNNDLVHILFDKQKYVHKSLLTLIKLIAEFYPNLRRITINEGINENGIYGLSNLLRVSTIREVFLDDTNVKYANYDILLEEPNNLQVLSLARCRLEDDAVKNIADKLYYPKPASQKLIMLNLSSNFLTNNSAKYLAAALRTNRKLAYLNLANNKISDDGGIAILNVLTSFPLTSEELTVYRHRYMEYLKKKIDFVKSYMDSHRDSTSAGGGGRSHRGRKAHAPKKLKDISASTTINATIESALREKAELLALKHLGIFNDPIADSTIVDDCRHCNGNTSLVYLSFSYNNLTYIFLKAALKVIQYQQSLNRTKGLKTVKLEGNLLPRSCPEFAQLGMLLERGLRASIVKTGSRQSIKGKK
ncbi:leucine-rich repeat-containing protein 71-like [Phthorimaea operculella]|nr:leucine-rich repeat-containing protein 71-like [Phthorimaea operculella]